MIIFKKYPLLTGCVLMLFCLFSNQSKAQNTEVQRQFFLKIICKDTSITALPIPALKIFNNLNALQTYTNALPQLLLAKGYIASSIDSAWQMADTLQLAIYLGKKYTWLYLGTSGINTTILNQIGYVQKNYNHSAINFTEVEVLKEKLLKMYERQGYPFAKVYLDSVQINSNNVSAILTANTLQLYSIDSIKNFGKLKFSSSFLQNYLQIKNGSVYNFDKLADVDRKLKELSYAEVISPSTLKMLPTGATLNLYANSRRSSEASAIIGFLPDANGTGKLQITGDVNVDLKNVFGGGEAVLFKFQALQPESPRLNLGFDKPYIFRSPFGTGFLFEMFKKDTTFLQVSATANVHYNLSTYQSGKILFQVFSNSILEAGIDTNQVKAQKRLPDIIDVQSTNIGVNYEYRKTNYRFNPVKGNEISLTSIIGIKNIKKSPDVIALSSPSFNYASLYDSLKLNSYQLKIKIAGAHYFQLSKSTTLKAMLNTAIYNSPNIFRNEVFQIGGYKLLRGFDEESIYATQYAVATAEFRALINTDSYFFTFVDAAITKAIYQNVHSQNNFISVGAGLLFQTKAGLLNLSLALGKRNDVPFNVRQASKIHFGYINYF